MRSDIHNELQDSVEDFYKKKGWIAIKEHCINGKKVDVLAQDIKTKYTIANEIQLSPKHALENILLDFRAGCNEVRIISISKAVSRHIEAKVSRELDKGLLKKTKFYVGEEFIPHLDNNKIQQNKAEFNAENNPEGNPERKEVI